MAQTISLALQGGGSHGAFTWGVLDALLEDPDIEFDGISGTSAGAMNAVALAHGFAQSAGKPRSHAREAARESLANFWHGIIRMGSMGQAHRAPFDLLFGLAGGAQSPAALWAKAMTNAFAGAMSPYQTNPFDLNPLKSFVERNIDFERLSQLDNPKVFVVATHVASGKAEVFSGRRLSASAVMASACLPMMFHAVDIDGEHYWDGGYSGNPAIHPLIHQCSSRDIMLVQINPIARDELPNTAGDIMNRLNEITFNAALIAEMRAIDFVKRLLAAGKLDPAHYKDVLMHRIDGGEVLEQFEASSKLSTDSGLLKSLHDLGQAQAKQWLKAHRSALANTCTVNIARDYLDDLRQPVHQRRMKAGVPPKKASK